jgi:O-antigen biosynthesis protein WbqP
MTSKRIIDITLSLIIIFIASPLIILIILMIKLTTNGKIFHISKRIGRNNELFSMYKFCTMVKETPNVATHLLTEPNKYITKIGAFLRNTSLDEFPQLWNILIGEMTFVGPRPALYNQTELIQQRSKEGIHLLTPGLTGWAQVNGRDELTMLEKIKFDKEYLEKKNISFDFYIVIRTISQVLKRSGIKH